MSSTSIFTLDTASRRFKVAPAVSLTGLEMGAAARLGPHRLMWFAAERRLSGPHVGCLAREVWHCNCESESQSSFHSGALSHAHLLTFLGQFKDELHCRPICTSKVFGRSP